MTKTRRTFTTEFKREAVSLAIDKGNTQAEAARSLGFGENLIGRWKRQLSEQQSTAFPGQGNLNEDQRRIRQLEDEVRRLRMDKEVLKKRRSSLLRKNCEISVYCPAYYNHTVFTEPPRAILLEQLVQTSGGWK